MNGKSCAMETRGAVETKRRRSRIRRRCMLIVRHVILLSLGCVFLLPVFVLLTRAFMSPQDIYQIPTRFFPSRMDASGFASAFDSTIMSYLANTLIVVGINVVFVPVSCLICSYGFAKLEFKGKQLIFGLILSTVMIPGIAMQIPLYILYYHLGLTDSLAPLYITAFFGGGAMNIFFMMQYLKGIPNSVIEAAKIDGANAGVIIFKIMLPLAKPVVTLVAVNTFIGQYNDYGTPLIYIWNEKYYTLALGLYYKYLASGAERIDANVRYAAGVMVMLPMVVVFAIFQKQLINGISTTGMKL